jgi:hypothetical protein
LDLNPALPGYATDPAHKFCAALIKPIHLILVIPVVGDLIAPLERGRGFDLTGGGFARPRNPSRRGQNVAGAQEALARHASPKGALSAYELTFHNDGRKSLFSAASRHNLTARPGTDHDYVVLVFHSTS